MGTEATSSAAPVPLTWRNWANIVAYAANCAVTFVSLTGIFGATNTELSKKYQLLVTPAGYCFSIWGPIFIWEGVFAVAQMLPGFRGSPVVRSMTPWWVSACFFQVAWTLFFAQDVIVGSLICMLCILVSLIGGILTVDSLPEISIIDFWLLRAPFSLHGGWIVAASVVNTNVLADSLKGSPAVMLSLTVLSLAAVASTVSLFTFATPRPDAIISLVAAWALSGISSELKQAVYLKDPSRFNFYDWPQVVLDGIGMSALILSIACLVFAVVAAVWRVVGAPREKLAAQEDAGAGLNA